VGGGDVIMFRQEELKRLHVIRKILEKVLKQVEAAKILSLSYRQLQRCVQRVKVEGDRGIIHRSRGKVSNRRLADRVKERVIKLYRKSYKGFGPTLAVEKLCERHGLKVSDETLRKWLLQSGDWKKVRRKRVHRQWRERKEHFGEMVQMDGSHHDWFEGRGLACVLMGYIDDATGEAFGRFYEYEGTMPAMDSFRRYIQRWGIPLSVYLDKHTTYRSPAKPSIEEELQGIEPLSEFERALKELGVEVIHAHSAPAKGRIERLFGTLQDRLVKEMRLRGIKSIEEANGFLEGYWPIYNRKFAVGAREEGDLHRSLPRGLHLDHILCMKASRALRNDFTVAYNKKLYQIEDPIRATQVQVHERLDGSIVLLSKDRSLKYREILTRPVKAKKQPVRIGPQKTTIPPKDHYWRNFKFGKGRYDPGVSLGSKL
jgi:hypothetical protein